MFKRFALLLLLLAAPAHAGTWTFDFDESPYNVSSLTAEGSVHLTRPGIRLYASGFVRGIDHETPPAEWLNGDDCWHQLSDFANEPTSPGVMAMDVPSLFELPGIPCAKFIIHSNVALRYVEFKWSAAVAEKWTYRDEACNLYPNITINNDFGALNLYGDYQPSAWAALVMPYGGGQCAWYGYAEQALDSPTDRWTVACAGDSGGNFCSWNTAVLHSATPANYILFALQPYSGYGPQPRFYLDHLVVSTGECPSPPCEFEARASRPRGEVFIAPTLARPPDLKRLGATDAVRGTWGRLKAIYR